MISEGTFRPPGNLFLRLIWRSFRPSGPWCFGVARGTFWKPAAAVALLLTRSRRDVNIGWIGLDSISSRILAG